MMVSGAGILGGTTAAVGEVGVSPVGDPTY